MTHALPCITVGLHVFLTRKYWSVMLQLHATGNRCAGLSLVVSLTSVSSGPRQAVSPCRRDHAAALMPCLAGLSLMASLNRDCSPGMGKVPHHARQAMQQLSV